MLEELSQSNWGSLTSLIGEQGFFSVSAHYSSICQVVPALSGWPAPCAFHVSGLYKECAHMMCVCVCVFALSVSPGVLCKHTEIPPAVHLNKRYIKNN